MPIFLDDIDHSAASADAGKVTPKFFSDVLTGSGKKAGLLNQELLPIKTSNTATGSPDEDMIRKRRDTQNDITVSRIPLDPRLSSTYSPVFAHQLQPLVFTPSQQERFELELTDHQGQPLPDLLAWFSCSPQSIIIRDDKSGSASQRDVTINYRMQFTLLSSNGPDPDAPAICGVESLNARALSSSRGQAAVAFSNSPLTDARAFVTENLVALSADTSTDLDELDQWLNDTSAFEQIQNQAQIWASDAIADHVGLVIDAVAVALNRGYQQTLNSLALQLRYLENYAVSLEAYKAIHEHLVRVLPEDAVTMMSKQNLNLLMSDTLNRLEAVKPSLNAPVAPTAPVTLPSHYSTQQRGAITTHDPLTLVQAGAGTGKSTVILERIRYLEACGVPASDITVLSFTNAAADNIKEKNPAVGSMTIAKMIIDIYNANHPTHKTSSTETVVNALEIFFPNNGMAEVLRQRLLDVEKNKVGAMTALNTFVEYNFDAVMNLLDRIKQATLELQIIVCYQRIDSMVEPTHVQSRHLIIDEVQDNSIFEFIYVLRYVAKHQESLFIVGDASQTLYEFRSANPRALNTLEASGVFSTHQLSTNYRSEQEILDFANLTLQVLSTNTNANIRLQANSLRASTEASFKNSVTLDRRLAPKLSSFTNDELGPIVRNTIAPKWVAQRIAAGERVCFLAFSRRDVATMQKALEAAFPNETVVSLISDRMFAVDIFSKFIRLYWNDILQTPPHNAAFAVTQGIQNNMHKLISGGGQSNPNVQKAIMGTVRDWWIENQAIVQSMVNRAQTGSMSMADFFEGLRDNLLDFEIRKNQEKMNVVKHRNQQRKQQNMVSQAKLLVSTIHGVKGLEFDHTVVLYKDESPMSEDKRRMYYVAFTRAMRSTYVLAYGTKPNSVIENQYEQIISALAERDQQNAATAATAAEEEAEQTDAALMALNALSAPAGDDQQVVIDGPQDGSVPVADLAGAVFEDDGGPVIDEAEDDAADAQRQDPSVASQSISV